MPDNSHSKIAQAIEEGILKRDLASLWCTVCKTNIQIISADSHLQGARHKKALKNSCLQEPPRRVVCDAATSSGTGLLAAIRKGQVESQSFSNTLQLRCVPCSMSYREEIPMIQHLASDLHAMNVRIEEQRQRLSPALEPSMATATPTTTTTTTPTRQIDSLSSTTTSTAQGCGMAQAANSSAGLYCSVCEIPCTGIESMEEHLRGRNHMKKLKMRENMQSLLPVREPSGATTTTTPSGTGRSDSACSTASSSVPGRGVAQAAPNPAERDGSSLYCHLCDVPFTGAESKEQHLRGQKHLKKLRLEAQRKSLSPAREPPVTTTTTTTRRFDSALPTPCPTTTGWFDSAPPSTTTTTSTAQGRGVAQAAACPAERDGSSLYCHLCDVPFTGAESKEQHLRGQKHLKKLRLEEQRQSLSPAREPPVATTTTTTTGQFESAPSTTTAGQFDLAPSSPTPTGPFELASSTTTTTSTAQGNETPQTVEKPAEVVADTDLYSLRCSLCDLQCTGIQQLLEHKEGKSHKKKLNEMNHRGLRDNLEDSPRPATRIDHVQSEQALLELVKDIRIYRPDESLSDLFEEVQAG